MKLVVTKKPGKCFKLAERAILKDKAVADAKKARAAAIKARADYEKAQEDAIRERAEAKSAYGIALRERREAEEVICNV